VIGKDGRKMVRFHSVFTDIPGLIQSQLIQKTLTDFDIKLIIDKSVYNHSQSEQTITRRLVSQIGEVFVNFLYVTHIPSEKNGKVKAVISFIK
jgi:phenylacetate-CoA ligase